MQTNRMPAHEALAYITQMANDYVRTLPASAAAPTGALAQQAIDALRPLVIGPVMDMPPPQEAEEAERRA